jgi:DNA-binding transcriptional ArsR family regulator
MDSETAIEALGALAQATRLEVFRLLVKHEPQGLAAGEIAKRLGVAHNTLSTHLAGLTRAGLTRAERHSRSIIYRADLAAIQELVAFLVQDCCGGVPEACAPPAAAKDCLPSRMSADA